MAIRNGSEKVGFVSGLVVLLFGLLLLCGVVLGSAQVPHGAIHVATGVTALGVFLLLTSEQVSPQ